jgi:hypothetical protein
MKEMERPLPGPTGMVGDSTWTGKDRRPKREERNNRGGFWRAAQACSVCYFVLIRLGHRGVHVLANEDEKLAFFSESRPRAGAFLPRSRETRWA